LTAHKQYVKSADDALYPQLIQLLSSEAPTVIENLPAGQSLQTEAPVIEYLPAGQLVHTEEPVTDLYLPPAHFTQLLWSGPVNPGLHKQLLEPMEELGDSEQEGFISQLLQAAQSWSDQY
jgi:hypothetical protein